MGGVFEIEVGCFGVDFLDFGEDFFGGEFFFASVGVGRGVAEPVDEEEEEVAVAVGAAGDGAVAGGKGGGVGLVWRVAVEGAGGEVFDIDDGAAAGGVWIVTDVVVAEGVVGPAAVEDGAEEVGGVVELVVKAVINFVAGSGVGAAEAGGGAVLDGVRPRVGDESLLFF